MRQTKGINGLVAGSLLVGLVFLSGCASRGYVRNQVGASAETLSAQIDENREGIARTQADLAEVSRDVAAQGEAISSTQSELEQTAAEIRQDVDQVETLARAAQTAADENAAETAELERRLGDLSRFDVRERQEVYFRFDSAEFVEDQTATLEAVKRIIDQDPAAIIVLEGRTDSLGDAEYNTRLGERRIETTRRYLVVELGVPFYRIHGFSFGASNPLYDNANLEERSKNRSVTVTVLGPASGGGVASSSLN